MKKTIMLLTASAIVLIASTGCTKHPKPDIVKYTVNGKNYEVTGAYSDLDFKGISKSANLNEFGFSAATETNSILLGKGKIFDINQNIYCELTNFMDGKIGMVFHNEYPDGTKKSFKTITNKKCVFNISKNESSNIEGNFSGWLYYMGMFGDEPISDSVEITNGYFYLAKKY